MGPQSALLLLGGLGLLMVGLLVAFFVFRNAIRTTRTCLLAGLLGVGAFVVVMIVAAVLAGRG
jgi:hypothetical protein